MVRLIKYAILNQDLNKISNFTKLRNEKKNKFINLQKNFFLTN
jgi:hypothetical protein